MILQAVSKFCTPTVKLLENFSKCLWVNVDQTRCPKASMITCSLIKTGHVYVYIYIHTSSVKKSKHLEPVGNQKQRVSEPTHCTLYLYTYIFTYIAYIHVLATTRHIHSLSYITILHITIYYRIDLYKLYILCIYIEVLGYWVFQGFAPPSWVHGSTLRSFLQNPGVSQRREGKKTRKKWGKWWKKLGKQENIHQLWRYPICINLLLPLLFLLVCWFTLDIFFHIWFQEFTLHMFQQNQAASDKDPLDPRKPGCPAMMSQAETLPNWFDVGLDLWWWCWFWRTGSTVDVDSQHDLTSTLKDTGKTTRLSKLMTSLRLSRDASELGNFPRADWGRYN